MVVWFYNLTDRFGTNIYLRFFLNDNVGTFAIATTTIDFEVEISFHIFNFSLFHMKNNVSPRLPDDLAARVHVLVNEGQKINKGKPATVIDVKPQGTSLCMFTILYIWTLFIIRSKYTFGWFHFYCGQWRISGIGTRICSILTVNLNFVVQLLNLPNPLESHKTFDNKIFLKSSDIGQVWWIVKR